MKMNTQQVRPTSPGNLLLIGAILVMVGSFLPWEIEGDLIPYRRYGIQLFPVFADHGGSLALLFSALMIGLIFRPVGSVKRPTQVILICAVALSVASTYHIVDWLARRAASQGIMGAPEIKIGLILVGIGSLITLVSALFVNFAKGKAN